MTRIEKSIQHSAVSIQPLCRLQGTIAPWNDNDKETQNYARSF